MKTVERREGFFSSPLRLAGVMIATIFLAALIILLLLQYFTNHPHRASRSLMPLFSPRDTPGILAPRCQTASEGRAQGKNTGRGDERAIRP
jgi:hypothetical protein